MSTRRVVKRKLERRKQTVGAKIARRRQRKAVTRGE